ncbi:MAG: hypothetical protein WD810_06540 [Solirubrobacterales bacterium]
MLTEPYNPPVADAQETKSPGTVATSEESAEQPNWTSPENAKSSNNFYATCLLEPILNPVYSELLLASNLGFALPEGATALGWLATVEKKASLGTYLTDAWVYPIKGGVVQWTAVNHASSIPWPTSDTVVSYGDASDLWGLEWTPAEINASGFGVAISCKSASAEVTASVDHVTVTVYYTEAESEDQVCFTTRSIELRSDGVVRQAREDDVWGTVIPDGFLPYTSPGGLEGRPSRGIIIPTQGDLRALPDSGTPNKLSATVKQRAGYHFAREAGE